MDAAEELYKRVKLYNLNHSKWLELLESIENEPRAVYNTAELDQRLFLLNDQLKTVQGQCIATRTQIQESGRALPTDAQFEMETQRLEGLRRERDEISSELKSVLAKIQQRDLLEAMKASLDNQLEVLLKEYETEEAPSAQQIPKVDTAYKELGERLNSLKAMID